MAGRQSLEDLRWAETDSFSLYFGFLDFEGEVVLEGEGGAPVT